MLLYMLSHHYYGIKMHHSGGLSTTIRHNFAYTLTLGRLNGLQRLPKHTFVLHNGDFPDD